MLDRRVGQLLESSLYWAAGGASFVTVAPAEAELIVKSNDGSDDQ